MTKTDLINKMASSTGITKIDSKKTLEIFLEILTDHLALGENVRIDGFGTFTVKSRKAKVGRNPITGAKIDIPATNVAHFSPAKHLKDSVKL